MSDQAKKVMTSAQIEALMEEARNSLAEEARFANILAEMRRIHYDAAIRKGFTPDQALALCVQTRLR